MPINERPYFFIPRVIRDQYNRGWAGYRTLVLGVFHVCTKTDCPVRENCLKDSSKYDALCPVYEGKDDYYRLSNSNEIELESYLEGEMKYPTYSSITKYLWNTNRHLPEEKKRKLWERIAFTNFLQNYRGDYDYLTYDKTHKELFDSQIPAFKAVLDELQPEVIYVADTAVSDCLRAHIEEFPGMEFIDEDKGWTLPIFRFTYKVGPKAAPDEILRSLPSKGNDEEAKIRRILENLGKCRNRKPCEDDEVIRPHIWDTAFENYLYEKLLEKKLDSKQLARLSTIRQRLYDLGYTESADRIVFNDDPPQFKQQYQQDGIIIEIANTVWPHNPETQKPVDTKADYYVARAVGYYKGNADKWRMERRKEYSDSCKNGNDYKAAIKTFISDKLK